MDEALAERRDERVCLVRRREQSHSTIAVFRGQRAHRELLRQLDRVDEALLGREGTESPDLARREEQDHEERIQDRGGGLEEVVAVGRDELPELVDERAKPGAADESCDKTGRRGDEYKE